MLSSLRIFLPLLLVTGCASITPIAYTAQPARITDPAGEVKALILANTVSWCVTEPVVTATMLTVKAVCSGGIANAVMRFDRVESIALEQSGEWYRVLVKHRGGAEDFAWTSKSLEDMQRLLDALTALSATAAPGKPATDTTKI